MIIARIYPEVLRVTLTKEPGQIHFHRLQLDFAFQELRSFPEVLERDDVESLNRGGLGGIFDGNQNARFAFRLGRALSTCWVPPDDSPRKIVVFKAFQAVETIPS